MRVVSSVKYAVEITLTVLRYKRGVREGKDQVQAPLDRETRKLKEDTGSRNFILFYFLYEALI